MIQILNIVDKYDPSDFIVLISLILVGIALAIIWKTKNV